MVVRETMKDVFQFFTQATEKMVLAFTNLKKAQGKPVSEGL